MKRIIILISILAVLLPTSKVNAQAAKEMLEDISGKYQIDDNGNVTTYAVIEVPGLTSQEIYNRALSYFTYNYGSGKHVIQTQDKEAGFIVGKGLYDDVHVGISLVTTVVDTWHVIRVDVKEGRARVVVTLTEYEISVSGGGATNRYTSKVSAKYPVNKKDFGNRTVMTKSFYKSFMKAQNSIASIEKAMREGNTSSEIENSDW